MTLRKRLRNRCSVTVAGALLFLLVPLFALAGCGPKEEEPTPTASGGAPAPGATPQTMPSLPPEVQVGPPK